MILKALFGTIEFRFIYIYRRENPTLQNCMYRFHFWAQHFLIYFLYMHIVYCVWCTVYTSYVYYT